MRQIEIDVFPSAGKHDVIRIDFGGSSKFERRKLVCNDRIASPNADVGFSMIGDRIVTWFQFLSGQEE